ncbi:Methyltransferase domain-containing protein [Lysobacter sp. yr284]|nr:Methyltransferase domain-containing protein [Lysobacter sp. yr284]
MTAMGKPEGAALLARASDGNFEEQAYLRANPDVAVAVRAGHCDSGRAHYDAFGRDEQRWLRLPVPTGWRREKLARLRLLMRPQAVLGQRQDCLDCLDDSLRTQFDLVATDNVSAHDYDERALALIAAYRDGLVLDCGAGLRNVYYRNVVNCEIVAYDSTDVLAAAERLPFVDGCFDAVLSLNVLEHVKDPFQAARELLRVLKPGGRLMCVAPFLQPLHGYPHHYYNMTRQGLENLFAALDERQVEIYGAMRPIWALQWFLSAYHAGLPEEQAARFAGMTVAELMAPPQSLQLDPIAATLDAAACTALASAHALFGRKPMT